MSSRRYIFCVPMALMVFLVVPQLFQSSNRTSDSYSRHLTQSDANKHLSPKPVDVARFTQDARSALNAVGTGDPSKPAKLAVQVELVQLVRGDLGKSLSIIAMGCIVKFFAQKLDPPVDVNIHYHTNNNLVSGVVDTKNDINTCFSNFENVDFYEFDDRRKQAELKHDKYGKNNHVGLDEKNEKDFGKMMKKKIKFISDKEYLEFQKTKPNKNFDYFGKKDPYLHCNVLPPPYWVDQYYHRLKKVFKFNNNCCKELPDPDETVVHIHGFIKEIKKYEDLIKSGYEEIDAMQMAQNMLGHLTAGDKVALVTPSPEIAQRYKAELEVRGIKVRTVSQNRVQDFCFLMNAKKELVGHHTSKDVFWAAILSNTVDKVSLYYVKNPLYTDGIHHEYDWKNPRLKDLLHYPVFTSHQGQKDALESLFLRKLTS